MKRFRLRDYSYIKYVFAILLLIVFFNLDTVTGFVANPGYSEKRIIDITLTSEDVWEFLLANPDFHVTVKELSVVEKEEMENLYPFYSGLPDRQLFEVLYYADAGNILVITDYERVLRVVP